MVAALAATHTLDQQRFQIFATKLVQLLVLVSYCLSNYLMRCSSSLEDFFYCFSTSRGFQLSFLRITYTDGWIVYNYRWIYCSVKVIIDLKNWLRRICPVLNYNGGTIQILKIWWFAQVIKPSLIICWYHLVIHLILILRGILLECHQFKSFHRLHKSTIHYIYLSDNNWRTCIKRNCI